MTTNLKLILAAAILAAPLPAYAQSAPEQRTVTLEDLCNGGATEYTNEINVLDECPSEVPASSNVPSPDDRSVGAFLICGYIDSPVCPRIFRWEPRYSRDDRVTAREWRQLLRPFPGWDIQPGARHFAKDVCSERDSLRNDRACYRAWLHSLLFEHRGVPSDASYITDRELAWFEPVAHQRDRGALCQAEIIAAREGRIGTAPLPGEEEISADNPLPLCSAAVIRGLLCHGPRDIIPDDDPGLVLYINRENSLENAKITLADNRNNACDPEENTP